MQATDRTVYVGNVGKEVDEAALLALFGHCGTVSRLSYRLMVCGSDGLLPVALHARRF